MLRGQPGELAPHEEPHHAARHPGLDVTACRFVVVGIRSSDCRGGCGEGHWSPVSATAQRRLESGTSVSSTMRQPRSLYARDATAACPAWAWGRSPGERWFVGAAALVFAVLMTGCRQEPEGLRAGSNANPAPAEAKSPAFVGSKSCRDCHADFYRRWSVSHHGLAMQPYTAGFAKENLTAEPGQAVKIGKRAYHVELEKTAGWMVESGPGGERKYRLAHVMGGKNVYYFLTPLKRGRLQVLPLAYDLHKKAWYDVAGSGVRHFPDRRDEALDWSDRLFTFNTTCFNCHVSQLATNYRLTTDTYQTT